MSNISIKKIDKTNLTGLTKILKELLKNMQGAASSREIEKYGEKKM